MYLARRNTGKIRNYLDQPNVEKLVHAFVTSKLDFCNSLLYGLSKKQVEKLQRILNAAARIKKTQKFQHISPVLRNLLWLSVTKRIEFKILTITYKALNAGMPPSYICDILQVRHPNRNLLHGSALLVIIGSTYPSDTGIRCLLFLCSYAPTHWYFLPVDNKNTQTLFLFKRKLKTFLINQF